VKRREFISLLGGAAMAWPRAAVAQPAMPVIGFLRSSSINDAPRLVTAFRQGLKEVGFVEGQNVAVEYHAAENDRDLLRSLAAELIRRPVAIIVTNQVSALVAKASTTTVPVVFATGSDPVRDGLVAALNRPGGNVTGVVFFGAVVGAKRLELLRQLVPTATPIAVLVGLESPETVAESKNISEAAHSVGQPLVFFDVASERDIERAFASFVQAGARAVITIGAFIFSHQERIVALAARHALPTCFANRELVEAGGLMSYGASITDAYRQVGIYVGRILKGEKPADLPVMQSTKFELVLNLRTAKALGIEVPDRMLALADEVIE
jgi:putative tryptophan/tyrosine transport system substrate-binding protein